MEQDTIVSIPGPRADGRRLGPNVFDQNVGMMDIEGIKRASTQEPVLCLTPKRTSCI